MSKRNLSLILFIFLFKYYQCQGVQKAYAKTDCLDYCEGNSQVSNDPTQSSLYEQCYYSCVRRLQSDQVVNFACKPWAQPAGQPKTDCQPFPGETFVIQDSGTQLPQAQNPTQNIQTTNPQRQPQVGQTTAQNVTRPAAQTGSQRRKLPTQNQVAQAPQNTQNGRPSTSNPQNLQNAQNIDRLPVQNGAQLNTQTGRPATQNQQALSGLQNVQKPMQNFARPPVQNGAQPNTQNGRPATTNQRGPQGLQNPQNVGRPPIQNGAQQIQNGRPSTLNRQGQLQNSQNPAQNFGRPPVQKGAQQNTQNLRPTALNQRGQQGVQNAQFPMQNVGRPIVQNSGQQLFEYGDYPMQNENLEYPWSNEDIESPPSRGFDPTPTRGQPVYEYNPSLSNPPQYGGFYNQYEDDY